MGPLGHKAGLTMLKGAISPMLWLENPLWPKNIESRGNWTEFPSLVLQEGLELNGHGYMPLRNREGERVKERKGCGGLCVTRGLLRDRFRWEGEGKRGLQWTHKFDQGPRDGAIMVDKRPMDVVLSTSNHMVTRCRDESFGEEERGRLGFEEEGGDELIRLGDWDKVKVIMGCEVDGLGEGEPKWEGRLGDDTHGLDEWVSGLV